VYQIEQARSSTKEHRSDGTQKYFLYVHREEGSLFRIQLQSPHSAGQVQHLWIGLKEGG